MLRPFKSPRPQHPRAPPTFKTYDHGTPRSEPLPNRQPRKTIAFPPKTKDALVWEDALVHARYCNARSVTRATESHVDGPWPLILRPQGRLGCGQTSDRDAEG